MRCLYCGKELALLKRWTGGGEFCSDSHRQQYQEEYNQLALNRLLQAKPQEAKSGSKPAEPAQSIQNKPAAVPPPAAAPVPVTAAQETRTIAAVAEEPIPQTVQITQFEPEPVEDEPEEDRAPAEPAGFLLEVPVPAMADITAMARSEADFERGSTLTLPSLTLNGWGTELAPAGQVLFEPSIRVMDFATRVSEGRLEVREFVRGAPLVEFDMKMSGETGIIESSEEPMDIVILPQPPQASPPIWQEPEREFAFETELGTQTRLTFRTTGLEDNESGEDMPAAEAAPVIHTQAEDTQPEAVAAPVIEAAVEEIKKEEIKQPAEVEEKEESPAPVALEPEFSEPESAKPESAKPESAKPESAKPESAKPESSNPEFSKGPVVRASVVRNTPPVFQKPMFRRPLDAALVRPSEPASSRPVEVSPMRTTSRPAFASEKPVEEKKSAEKMPEVATKPLPLTLHGLAAGRGKPVQVFPSAVASGVDLQIPRSSGLPLRPVMTLGPAPAAPVKEVPEAPKSEKKPERSVLIKPDPKKRPDPRFGNGKGRKPEPEKVELEKKAQPEIAQPAVPVIKDTPEPAKAAAPKPDPVKTPEPVKPAAKETLPAPLAAPYEAPDLGLPSLSLDASGSFWSKLPVAGKVGAGLLVALVIGGIFYMMSKGGGTAASGGPRVVEAAPALAASEGGWITDWGAEQAFAGNMTFRSCVHPRI